MHPSPTALLTMTTADLMAYREELRTAVLDDGTKDHHDHPYRVRIRLIDAIVEDRKAPAIEADAPAILDAKADDAATMCGWSDRNPGTIIKRTAKTIVVQFDDVSNMSGEGHDAYAHGSGEVVIFTRNTDAPTMTYTLRKNGRWIASGAPANSRGSGLIIGTRSYYRDPSF
jgi:hypothetical protein